MSLLEGDGCSVKYQSWIASVISRIGFREGPASAVLQRPFQDRALAPQRVYGENRTAYLYSALLFAILIVISVPTAAQTSTGTLHGQVTDPSGAVVTNAQVSAVSSTGQTFWAKTNANGTYELGGLPPGQYTITATARGFAAFTQLGLAVNAGQVQKFDIPLDIQ